MFRCNVCGKKFKSKDALGGHVSSAHPQKKAEDVSGSAKAEETIIMAVSEGTPQAQPTPPSENDPGVMERIRILFRQKYTPKQIKEQFGYAPRTVDQVALEFIKPEGLSEEEEQDKAGLPILLKDGKGEILSPEAVYYKLVTSDGTEGERDFKALMKWAAAIEMVQRMTQIRKAEAEALAEMAKPVLEMMSKSREELDAAVARAKESSMAIAEAAAAGAAARATMRIDERFNELKQQKPDIATVQDPMKGIMARTMEMLMNRLTGVVVGGEVPPTPGLVDKRIQQGG